MVNFPNPLPAILLFDRQKIDVKILADDIVANGDRVMTVRYTPDKADLNPKSHSKYMFTDNYNQKREDRLK